MSIAPAGLVALLFGVCSIVLSGCASKTISAGDSSALFADLRLTKELRTPPSAENEVEESEESEETAPPASSLPRIIKPDRITLATSFVRGEDSSTSDGDTEFGLDLFELYGEYSSGHPGSRFSGHTFLGLFAASVDVEEVLSSRAVEEVYFGGLFGYEGRYSLGEDFNFGGQFAFGLGESILLRLQAELSYQLLEPVLVRVGIRTMSLSGDKDTDFSLRWSGPYLGVDLVF